MALIDCPECGRSISTAAATCPHCGFPMQSSPAQFSTRRPKQQPPKGRVSGGFVLVTFACLGIWIWYQASDSGSSPDATAAPAAQPENIAAPATPAKPVGFDVDDHYFKNQDVPDAACKPSLACWSDKHLAQAEVACKAAVAAQSTYEVKWTDGMLHPMFSRVKWSELKGDDSIVYLGDEVELQNQFGAFEPMTYACPYNVEADKVTAAVLYPGKLPAN